MIATSICLMALSLSGVYSAANMREADCRIIYDKHYIQEQTSRNFIFGEVWPGNKIPYEITSGYTSEEVTLIKDAMKHIEGKSCVTWVPRSGEDNYVLIKHDDSGCFANLGYNRNRGMHVLNLQRSDGSTTCMIKGIAIHEMLHIMGFAHEQTRPDRDNFVKIKWENIRRDAISNFFRYIAVGSSERPPVCDASSPQVSFDDCYSGFRSDTFGFAYDYGSIMHYGAKYFSTNGQNTIEVTGTLPAGTTIGSREGMTDLDSQKTQAKYGCNGQTTTTKKPSVECRDKYVQCSAYKSYCNTHDIVKKGCPVTCGDCKECKDNYSNCGDLSFLCGGNDNIDANCKLSCNTC